MNTGTEVTAKIQDHIITLLGDKAQTSHEAKLVQKFYNDFVDMEARDKLGVEPILPQINAIREIGSIAELTDYYITDWDIKLTTPPVHFSVSTDSKDSNNYVVQIQSPDCSLENTGEYVELTPNGKRQKQAVTLGFGTMLQRVGYTQEEASRITEELFDMEGKIQEKSYGLEAQYAPNFFEKTYNPISLEELKKANTVFPIAAFLEPYTQLGVERFINVDPGWLAQMNTLYTEENLEGFKAILLYQVISSSLLYLDREAFNLEAEMQSIVAGSEIVLSVEDIAYKHMEHHLDMAVGKMYADNYVSPETKRDITKMVEEIIAVYRGRLANIDWLTESTKDKAIEKLDAIKFKIAYPDDWTAYDYSSLVFADEGGILDDLIAIQKFEKNKTVAKATKKVDKSLWTMAPQVPNASYSPAQNTIEIMAGILADSFYKQDNPVEVNMGGIGAIIAHEITHAFDPRGGKYDKDGNMNDWWTEEDRTAFQERTAKVSEYFSQFEVLPGIFVKGSMTVGEAVADLGAVSCMLEIAKGIDGFDYTAFFESYASCYKKQILPSAAEQLIQQDPHPPGYVRVNAILQQSQEFYDAIGIKAGDGMYLAKEKRFSVW